MEISAYRPLRRRIFSFSLPYSFDNYFGVLQNLYHNSQLYILIMYEFLYLLFHPGRIHWISSSVA
jgi:hypothetical protein